jgi:tripeptide aminopeptidase
VLLPRLIDDILSIARIPAPTFAEEQRLRWIESRLADCPGKRDRDHEGNLIWSWGDGPAGVVFAAHVDTVFPVETPLDLTQDDGWLGGPGIGDNAAAVALVINVLEALLCGGTGLRPAAVAFTVGEEGLGNLRGAKAVCEHIRPLAFVAVEGHGLEHVVVDAVASLRARLTVTGPGGHSWTDRGRPSAIHALLELGSTLVEQSNSQGLVNIGTISGGRSVNSIADRAELLVEVRALDEGLLERFEAKLGQLTVPQPLVLSTDVLGYRPGGRLERTEPLLACIQAVRAELDLPQVLAASSTDANAALSLGIPAIAIGAARGEDMHSLQERIEINSLAPGAAQLERLVLALLHERDRQRTACEKLA